MSDLGPSQPGLGHDPSASGPNRDINLGGPTHFESLLWHQLRHDDPLLGEEPNRGVIRQIQVDAAQNLDYDDPNFHNEFDVAVLRAMLEMPDTAEELEWEELASIAEWSWDFRDQLIEGIDGDFVLNAMARREGYQSGLDMYHFGETGNPELNPWYFSGRIAATTPPAGDEPDIFHAARPRAEEVVRQAYARTRTQAEQDIAEREQWDAEEGEHETGGLPTAFERTLLEEARPLMGAIVFRDPTTQEELHELLDVLEPEEQRGVVDMAIDQLDGVSLPHEEIIANMEALSRWSPDFRYGLRHELAGLPQRERIDLISGYRFDFSEGHPPIIRHVVNDRRVNPWAMVRNLRHIVPSDPGRTTESALTIEAVDHAVGRAFVFARDRALDRLHAGEHLSTMEIITP